MATTAGAGGYPTIWALHDGKTGMANQAIGLAEAIGWRLVEKRLVIRAPWRLLPPAFWPIPLAALDSAGDALAPPWPDLVIAVGRLATAPAVAVKRASGGATFWAHIQDPRHARREADLIVAPGHDPATGDNVFTTLGAVHRVTPERLAAGTARLEAAIARLPRPLVAVLIGGGNRVYRLTEARLASLADQLGALAASGFGLMVTPSRRTGDRGGQMLRERLAGLPAFVWDGSGENPYFGMLGLADAIIVTADSVSMVSEAAATGKPVHVVALDGGSAKFRRFHQAMAEAGITRPFRGGIERWSYPPLDDTARAAAEIRERFRRKMGRVA